MTITADGWHDFAERQPGPASNRYSWNNNLTLYVKHSMVGYYATTRAPVWTGTILYDGRLIQHFPVWAGLPHAGPNGNPYGPGYESEGGVPVEQGGRGVDEPLTIHQVRTWIRIIADLEELNPNIVGREHRELAQTACPSGRYWPLYEALTGEEEMTPEEREEHQAIVAILGGREKLLKARDEGQDFLLGYALEQAEQNKIEEALRRAGVALKGEDS